MKKKLIIFIPSIEDGGVEKNLYIVSNYLNNKGINVNILTINHDKLNKFQKGTKFIGLASPFLYKRGRLVKYLVCLITLFFHLLTAKQKSLVFAFQANIYAVLVAKILNTKIITRSNSAPSGWNKNIIKNFLYKFLINLADDVMVNSFEFKKTFEKKFNKKVKCIYNPFDKKFIEKQLKNKKKSSYKKKNYLNIVSVGRLTNQKDHLTLLKSIKLIKPNIRIKLNIIGKGQNKRLLQNFIVQNKLQDRIKLKGYLNNPFPYIYESDIVVLTSTFEGLPNILLEAQYLKKYIISTNCSTGPKEILLNGKAGDLIKIGDYRKLSFLICNYFKRKKIINSMIKVGTKNFYRFNYSSNCKKYLDFVSKNE